MTVAWEDYEYLECRDYGHAWQYQGTHVERSSPMRYVRLLRCLRCKTVRKDRIDGRGERTGNYDYPETYRLDPVTPADRRRLRLHNVKRASRGLSRK